MTSPQHARQHGGTPLTAPLILLLGSLSALALFTVIAASSGSMDRFDVSIHDWVAAHRSATLVHVASVVTHLAGTVILVPLFFLVAVMAAQGQLTGRLRLAALATGVLISGLVVRFIVSGLVGPPRPAVADWASGASGYAFPSGHTTGATIAALLLGWLVLRREGGESDKRALVWSLAGVFAVGIGITRVYIGVHWPSDVLGGWAFGLAWTTLAIVIVGSLELRWHSHGT